MTDILFSESAASSIQVAKSVHNITNPSISVILRNADGSFPTPDELAKRQAQVEEEYRRIWQNTIPVEGEIQDVACFPLNLSIGDISEPFSDNRADFLQSLVVIADEAFSGVGRELMETSRKSQEKVKTSERPVRIWTSRHPDEFCGFCHILTQLPKDADIRVVELPAYEVLEDEIRTYGSWADVEPTDFGRFQALERHLTDMERRYFMGIWRELKAENGPLRAVINGRLCTVAADFYDDFIFRELEKQPEEFHEARLIGQILGTYPPGPSDSLIALRIEDFISQGILTPATQPEPDHPIYHRFLKKTVDCP